MNFSNDTNSYSQMIRAIRVIRSHFEIWSLDFELYDQNYERLRISLMTRILIAKWFVQFA